MKKARLPLLPKTLLLVTLGFIVWSVALTVQDFLLSQKIAEATTKHTTLQSELNTLEENTEALHTYRAMDISTEIRRTRRNWSKVLTEVRNSFPSYITLEAFQASEDNRANLTALGSSYVDTISLMRVMKKNTLFKEVFIPSLSKGVSQTQEEVISFPVEMLLN